MFCLSRKQTPLPNWIRKKVRIEPPTRKGIKNKQPNLIFEKDKRRRGVMIARQAKHGIIQLKIS